MYQRFNWTGISEGRNALTKLYEPVQPFVLVEFARSAQADAFIDVGANIGLYSFFLSSLESVKKIHAFEPSPKTFAELERNVALNSGSRVVPHRQAVSDTAQTLTFGIIDDYSGANCIVEGSIHSEGLFKKEEVVDCVRLDDLDIDSSKALCLKVDVEGHESKVILGAEATLAKHKAIIQMESYRDDDPAKDLLNRLGYKRLLSVGPDSYYSNIAMDGQQVVEVLERAMGEMIASNFERVDPRRPFGVKFLPGLKLEVSGGPASFIRKLKKSLSGS